MAFERQDAILTWPGRTVPLCQTGPEKSGWNRASQAPSYRMTRVCRASYPTLRAQRISLSHRGEESP